MDFKIKSSTRCCWVQTVWRKGVSFHFRRVKHNVSNFWTVSNAAIMKFWGHTGLPIKCVLGVLRPLKLLQRNSFDWLQASYFLIACCRGLIVGVLYSKKNPKEQLCWESLISRIKCELLKRTARSSKVQMYLFFLPNVKW